MSKWNKFFRLVFLPRPQCRHPIQIRHFFGFRQWWSRSVEILGIFRQQCASRSRKLWSSKQCFQKGKWRKKLIQRRWIRPWDQRGLTSNHWTYKRLWSPSMSSEARIFVARWQWGGELKKVKKQLNFTQRKTIYEFFCLLDFTWNWILQFSWSLQECQFVHFQRLLMFFNLKKRTAQIVRDDNIFFWR